MTGDPDVTAKVAFLRRPSSHPERPARIAVVETHFAWIFIGDRLVRKLKKPIKTDWLDFSSLERRFEACANEVALNRALAPDIYFGVEPLVLTEVGGLALDRPGRTVDAVVLMRRLPAARALDYKAARLLRSDLEPLVACLAGFYREGVAIDADPKARCEKLRDSLANLQSRLREGPLRSQEYLMARLLAFVEDQAPLISARAEIGRVVDAHGDLRPEHVYLTRPPRILDRLEFGLSYRLIDWLEDIALLAVDLERQGQGWIGDALMRAVADALGDQPSYRLWCFYRGWRALLRAQLAVEHLDRENGSPGAESRTEWLLKARSYLAIAKRHTRSLTAAGAR